MKTVYAVTQSPALKEPAIICEDKADAVILAEQINYMGDDQSPEDFIVEVPLIVAEQDEVIAGAFARAVESALKLY